MNEGEKVYLNKLFVSLSVPAIVHLRLQDRHLSLKARLHVELLAHEMSPGSAGIIFVKTRAAVKLLSVLLMTHPVLKDILRIGTCVGTSNKQARTSNLSDLINISNQKETLNNLRNRTKNLIIATSICEEGIGITACNIVICFEQPPNLREGEGQEAKSPNLLLCSRRGKRRHFSSGKASKQR